MPALHNLKLNSALVRPVLLACTVLMAAPLTGCGTSGALVREPATRSIPPSPSYLVPAQKPPAVGSPFVVAEKRGAVIDQQNSVIVRARKAWDTMRSTYSKSFLKKKLFGGY